MPEAHHLPERLRFGVFELDFRPLTLLIISFCSCLLAACGGGNATGVKPSATHLAITASSAVTVGMAFNITVQALDASNNTVATYSGVVHFSSSDAQALLPANSTLTNGVGGFSVTLNTAGSQTITATDTVTGSVNGTSSGIAVSAGAATHFSVTAPPNVTAGSAFSFTVTALDVSNNTATTYMGTVKFSTTDNQGGIPSNSTLKNGTGTFSATLRSIGNQTITATDTVTASISGNSNSINVSGPPATHLSVNAPATATAGTAFNLVVTALDSMNNLAIGYSGTVHFTSSDSQADLPANSTLVNGTATFSAALKTTGNQTITATDTATASITGTSNSINVAVAAAVNPVPLVALPLNPAAALPGGPGFTLTVNGTGFVSGSVVKWNGNTRTTNFVGNSRLTANILATDIASFNTALVTVVNPAPGGGTSNVAFFETTRPTSSVALGTTAQLADSFAPISVTTGDFNGDGKLDLAVANNGDSSISIFLGNGDGTFQPAVSYGAGANPAFIAVGDFNGDGKLDLAVANNGGSSISIFLGNGDGTFQPGVQYSTASYPSSVAVGDFNADGKLDLVVGYNFGTDVSVFLGNGDGTFQPALSYNTGLFPTSVAVGDFNSDGRLDLAVANFGGNVSVLLGNGDGTFQPTVNYASGPVPTWIVAGDFNGDGKLDLAVSNIGDGNTGPSNVSVLLGNGDGTFQTAVDYPTGPNTSQSSVTLGDFNGDGKLDLVVVNLDNSGNSSISILLGNGDGTFQAAVAYGAEATPLPVATGDFNDDGRLDMAVADGSRSGVSILLQPGLASGPNAVLTPASLTFATQLVGTTSPKQSVLLSNYGTTTVSIMNISATGNFSEVQSCGSSLAAGASCTIDVSFVPSAPGNLAGMLSVTDDAPGSPQTIFLSGTGTAVELSSTSVRFSCLTFNLGPQGFQCICTRGQTITLTNAGNTALSISDITITGPFSQSNSCPNSLGAGQSCSITINWSHVSGGGLFSITDNGGGSPQTVSLFGFAQCMPPAISSSVSASPSAGCVGK